MAKEQIYPYAVARIRVLEKNLLSNQVLNQMTEEREISGCFRTLAEHGYDYPEEPNSIGIEKMLSAETEKTYSIIRDLVPTEKFIDVFLYKNDYHNLKVLIKSEVSGINGEHFLIDGGTVPVSKLKKSLLDRNYSDLPVIMGKAIAEAFSSYSKTQSGRMIDTILDKAAFRQMKEGACESKNQFVIDYVSKMCDLTNLKSFLRIKKMNKDFTAFSSVFVEGGILSLNYFLNAFSMDNPINSFKATAYGWVCEEGMHKGFTEFEKLCDNYMMNYVKDAKFKALTLEPLVAYLYAKESEIKTVRIITSGKLNHIDSKIIKERVREAYA
ncbi:MAG: V-type ATP synthase subunit C [Epulopiscium sp.]|jgi:V/A-type H+-transporting ATPase subunit C|nr:V-type ATP synthase subunit C [Candidatus Epulonipiscium sp.]